jgi:hypothetical protein
MKMQIFLICIKTEKNKKKEEKTQISQDVFFVFDI